MNLAIEFCRLKPSNAECGKINLSDREVDFKFMEWNHFCSTFKTTRNDTHISTEIFTYNGGLLKSNSTVVNDKPGYLELQNDGTLVLGQDQDIPGGGYDREQAFSGEISQFGIWDRVLSQDEIVSLANCTVEKITDGSVATWDINLKDEWEISDDVELEENVPLMDLCGTPDLLDIFVQSEKLSYNKFKPI